MGPFKCPDCGVWWAGLEHRCRAAGTDNTTVRPPFQWPPIEQFSSEVRCTCPRDRGDNYLGNCPIHDVRVTYTGTKVMTGGLPG